MSGGVDGNGNAALNSTLEIDTCGGRCKTSAAWIVIGMEGRQNESNGKKLYEHM